MSASADALPPAAAPVVPWTPSPHLRSRLLLGLVCLAVAVALAFAGSALQVARPNESGFTLALALGLASFLPRIGILLAYLGLASETGSDGLKRTSVDLFGADGLFQLLGLADETILPPEGVTTVQVVAVVAGLALMLYCFLPLFKEVGCVSILLVWLVLRGVKHLPSLFPELKQFDGTTQWLLVVGTLEILFLLVLQVWFGIALIRLREQLGKMAALAGWGHLLGVVAFLGLFAWFVTAIVGAANRPDVAEQELSGLIAPQLTAVIGVAAVGELVGAVLTALLFQAARMRGPSDSGEQVRPGG